MQELIRKVEAYDFECEAGPLTQCVYWHSLYSAIDALRAENANLRALSQGQTAFHSDEAVNEEMGRLRAENEELRSKYQALGEVCDGWEKDAEQSNALIAALVNVIRALKGASHD